MSEEKRHKGGSAVIVPVVAALLGSIVGGTISYAVQGQQLEHEDRTRFNDARYAAYREYLAVAIGIADGLRSIATRELTDQERQQEVGEVSSEFRKIGAMVETFRLLSSPAVISAGLTMTQTLAKLQEAAYSTPVNIGDFRALERDLESSKNSFAKAVRTELGL